MVYQGCDDEGFNGCRTLRIRSARARKQAVEAALKIIEAN